MKRYTARAAVGLALVLLLAFAPLVLASCGSPSFGQSTENELEAAVQRIMSKYDVPGSIVGVWWEGEGEFVRAFGEADIEESEEMATDDLFRAGSITKTMTAEVVLLLVKDGEIALEDTLSEFEFAEGLPNADRITVRDLLRHTSGYGDFTNEDEEFVEITLDTSAEPLTSDEIMEWGARSPVPGEPGDTFHYSNWGYYLLGMIIEEVSGRSVEDVMQERLFDGLGLENTRLDSSGEFLVSREHSNGYMLEKGEDGRETYEDMTDADYAWCWTAGALVSDLFDLKTWIEAVADGTLLNPELQQEQLVTVKTKKDDSKPPEELRGIGNIEYGLGVSKSETELGTLVWHNGAVWGYSSFAGHIPDQGLTIVTFTNLLPAAEEDTLTATRTASAMIDVLREASD